MMLCSLELHFQNDIMLTPFYAMHQFRAGLLLCSADQPAPLSLQSMEWHCQESPTSSTSSQKVRPISVFVWKLLRSLVGSPEEQRAMNNECLFVRTLLVGSQSYFYFMAKALWETYSQTTLQDVWGGGDCQMLAKFNTAVHTCGMLS